MSYLIDTNILLRIRDNSDPHYIECVAAIDMLRVRNECLFISAQILAEYWVVLTRPRDVNGCGLEFDEAATAIYKVRTIFPCLSEPADIADRWQQVILGNKVMGRQAHDARIVSLMLAHGVPNILSLNTVDFNRYPRIAAFTPKEVLNS